MMQDVMLSSHGGQPSSAIHHRMCYKSGQKGHYAKGCPQKHLSPAPRQAGQQGRPAQPRAPRQGKSNHVTAKSVAESSERGYWYVHGQLSSSYSAFRYRCYSFFHHQVICREAWYTSFLYEDSYGSYLTWGIDAYMLYMLQS